MTLSELTYYRGVEMENGMIVFNMHPAKPNYKLPPDPDVPEPETTAPARRDYDGNSGSTVKISLP